MAVGQAKSALSDALDTQTKAIGVILPPPDIRVSGGSRLPPAYAAFCLPCMQASKAGVQRMC